MRRNVFLFLEAQRPRLVLWAPVLLMVGIGWYFTLPDEPPAFLGPRLFYSFAFLLLLTWRRPLRWLVLPPFIIALGFACAQFRAQQVMTPLLSCELKNHWIEGAIDEIEPAEKKEKLVLSHLVIEDLPPAQTPTRVRISVRGEESGLQVGDRVQARANLYPLPGPTLPGGYDFARHFYFRSIGGNGFALGPVTLVGADQPGASQWLGNLRRSIGERMRAAMPGETGAVAAAMTVGETGPIPEEAKVILRDSGLAHILSISGLHLAIAAGLMFFTVRLMLALYPPLALRLPVKKIAAVFALLGAFIYLLLAGYPVPAQRAFIMVAFLFLAMLIDRRGITLRTLMIAAMCILLLLPESMFGASFQMSFAATLAIVSLYETFGRRLNASAASMPRRVLQHTLGIVLTSLAATLATSVFVLYHFNRLAVFGLISNMLVIPLATFVIMPGMVLSLLLMPLGLEWIGYLPLAWGTDFMIAVGDWVRNLPYSSLRLPSPSDAGLALAAFGLLFLCLTLSRWRLLGFVMVAAGLFTMTLHKPVDIFVGDDLRQVMARLDDGSYTALKGTARSFAIQNWLCAEGQEALVPLKQTAIECDKQTCLYRRNGYGIRLVKKSDDDETLAMACAEKSDLLLAWRYVTPDSCPGPARLIDRRTLEQQGAHAIYLEKDTIRLRTAREGQGRRIWQPVLESREEEEY